MNIILVHGIFDDATIYRKMAGKLSALGHECFAPSLKPADARKGISDLSHKLRDEIDETFKAGESFVLIAFSMGCLVARFYLQELGGLKRCQSFHAISGPHRGSLLAYLYPGQGAKEMRPGSDFLRRLKGSGDLLADTPVYSYRTPFDLMIIPSSSSQWEIAENIRTMCPIHPRMVNDRLVFERIVQSFRGLM
jgi:triacylglycerol lipase